MILCDFSIKAALTSGRIGCTPCPTFEQYQPASLDLTLGRSFKKFTREYPCPIFPDSFNADEQMFSYEADVLLIMPGEFILGATVERIRLPADLRGCLHGRSSLARLGLLVHVTAGYIDPGFDGTITLEFANLSPRPIHIPVGFRVAQISFEEMDFSAAMPYGQKVNSKYQGQEGPVGSLVKKDTENG